MTSFSKIFIVVKIYIKFTISTILRVQFSGISTFTLLCNCYHHPSLEPSHLPKRKLHTLRNNSSLPHSPTPGNYFPSPWTWLPEEPLIRGIILYSPFCDRLISLGTVSSRSIHAVVRVRISFFWGAEMCPLHGRITFFFIHPSVLGHLSCRHLVSTVDNAAVNTGVQTSLQDLGFNSSGCIPFSGTPGSYGNSRFDFLMNHHPVFHNSCTVYIPTNDALGFLFLCPLTNTYFLFCW